MAVHINNLDLGLLFGVFGGVVSFFRGFRVYREYLRVQGTPAIPIRSIAMGLVRIHGKAASENPVTSPISHTPCCFYQVRIQKWRDNGESGTWVHYGADSKGDRFYLEDSSGRVLVEPRGAECDIESTALRETSGARAGSAVAGGDAELLAYAARVGPSAETPGTQHSLEFERVLVATSQMRKQPGTPDEIMRKMFPQVLQGEARMVQALEAEGPHSDPMREELRQAQIELNKHPYWSPEYAEGRKRVIKLQAQVGKAPPAFGAPPPLPAAAPPQGTPTAEEIVASINGPLSATGRYRFTEICILPDHEYDVTGTCALNPEAKDATDRNLIRKGAQEPTFLISGLGRTEVNVMLQSRSMMMIFGGGMLAVFCLGILLLRLGQF